MGQFKSLHSAIFALLLSWSRVLYVLLVAAAAGQPWAGASPRLSVGAEWSSVLPYWYKIAAACQGRRTSFVLPHDSLPVYAAVQKTDKVNAAVHKTGILFWRFGCAAFLENHGNLVFDVCPPKSSLAAMSLFWVLLTQGGARACTSTSFGPGKQDTEVRASCSSLPCGLPRAVRGSTMMMPGSGHTRGKGGAASAFHAGSPKEETPSEQWGLDAQINTATVLALDGGPERAEAQQQIDDKNSVSAAAGRLLESARLLEGAAAGHFCVLPLGFRVLKKIEFICHQELAAVGAAPLSLPSIMPLEWLRKSNRLAAFGPSLYRLHDRRGRELFLPPTCEEAAAWLAATGVRSHRELPLLFYQIGPKFRDEPRPRAGCLRAREFIMLEAYSFHQDAACRDAMYQKVDSIFRQILSLVGATPAYRVEADSGTMGGPCSHEYHVPTVLGEDHLVQSHASQEPVSNGNHPASYSTSLHRLSAGRTLEVGHCFQLPGTYCETAGARFTDSSETPRVPLMNSYGLGVSRLLGHLALAQHDARGLSFPPQVAPFSVAVLPQPAARWSGSSRAALVGEAVFKRLEKIAAEAGGSADVVLDDRRGPTLRQIQAHADLVGIPHQVVIKDELLRRPGPPRVLYIPRSSGVPQALPLRAALGTLRTALQQASMGSPSGSVVDI